MRLHLGGLAELDDSLLGGSLYLAAMGMEFVPDHFNAEAKRLAAFVLRYLAHARLTGKRLIVSLPRTASCRMYAWRRLGCTPGRASGVRLAAPCPFTRDVRAAWNPIILKYAELLYGAKWTDPDGRQKKPSPHTPYKENLSLSREGEGKGESREGRGAGEGKGEVDFRQLAGKGEGEGEAGGHPFGASAGKDKISVRICCAFSLSWRWISLYRISPSHDAAMCVR